jgi:hypothetical protein
MPGMLLVNSVYGLSELAWFDYKKIEDSLEAKELSKLNDRSQL